MLSAQEAQETIRGTIKPLGTEEVPLSESLGRFLANPIIAPIDLPPFDNAAMDGVAVRSGDTQNASEETPIALTVIGTISAGEAVGAFQPLMKATTYRIMTGAPVPKGADAVVPFEETGEDGAGLVTITKPIVAGSHIRRTGEDVREGEKILTGGTKVTSRTIALLAALGIDRVPVFKKPRVKVLLTGSELVPPGEPLPPGKIYNSNGFALGAALREIGIIPETLMTVPDDPHRLKEVIRASLGTDLLMTVGAASAGDRDYLPQVFDELHVKKLFHKVAIKPGKPLLFGIFERGLIFGLPGNPVSALMVFERFVRPALLLMMGSMSPNRSRRLAIAGEELKGTQGKEDSLRGIVEHHEGGLLARSAGAQGSASLVSLATANATLIIPPERERIGIGEPLEVELWEDGL